MDRLAVELRRLRERKELSRPDVARTLGVPDFMIKIAEGVPSGQSTIAPVMLYAMLLLYGVTDEATVAELRDQIPENPPPECSHERTVLARVCQTCGAVTLRAV